MTPAVNAGWEPSGRVREGHIDLCMNNISFYSCRVDRRPHSTKAGNIEGGYKGGNNSRPTPALNEGWEHRGRV
jgi:hypothetical protein